MSRTVQVVSYHHYICLLSAWFGFSDSPRLVFCFLQSHRSYLHPTYTLSPSHITLKHRFLTMLSFCVPQIQLSSQISYFSLAGLLFLVFLLVLASYLTIHLSCTPELSLTCLYHFKNYCTGCSSSRQYCTISTILPRGVTCGTCGENVSSLQLAVAVTGKNFASGPGEMGPIHSFLRPVRGLRSSCLTSSVSVAYERC